MANADQFSKMSDQNGGFETCPSKYGKLFPGLGLMPSYFICRLKITLLCAGTSV